MNVLHVTERCAREGTIDDVFQRLAEEDEAWVTMLELLSSLCTHIVGPDVWAYESHSQLVLIPFDGPNACPEGKHATQISIIAHGNMFSVGYEIPRAVAALPWYSMYSVKPSTTVQATITCWHPLCTMWSIFDSAVQPPTLRNDNPVMTTRCTPDGLAKCPHCEAGLSMHDSTQWNGGRHTLCQQRLNIHRKSTHRNRDSDHP